ncbi:MAG: aminopeptidase [Bacteroidaceae bacterium]|nr:aminopeptidase [Bacteroidaceae bacterium]
MIKTIALVLLCVLYAACAGQGGNESLYCAGVSQQLAEHRAQNISDVHYSLSFSIPYEKDSAVVGCAEISFKIAAPQEVVLDFRDLQNVSSVAVNGTALQPVLCNEHIILPATAMVAGENSVLLSFVAGNQSLNRNNEYLYTLFVPDRARTAFPCFDQPSMKALFELTLEIPAEWVAVSNTAVVTDSVVGGRRLVSFGRTEPLSTYLFSFVAGKFSHSTYNDKGRTITAYHRETDAARVAQLPVIFNQVVASLDWLEEYTGIAYPFAKYDFVILPGFQYGGMEHTGATLYNDAALFLGAHPTPDEVLSRAQIIAHETAHMWFGDLVTMEWFDDVWTKEVFANYFEARMTEPLFPQVNHRLERLRRVVVSAMSEDRTMGTTPIKQPLGNLNDAGLVYSNIIYDKAPVMLEKLVEIMGEDAFREGVRDYLHRFSYGNATWEGLIDIFDSKCSADLRAFSNAWVHERGMPHISFLLDGQNLVVRQSDPLGRGLVWPQRFNVRLVGDTVCDVRVSIADTLQVVSLPCKAQYILPNSDGRGYGYFRPCDGSIAWLLSNWWKIDDEVCRQAQLINLHECYQLGVVEATEWINSVIAGLEVESDALVASTLCSYLPLPLSELRDSALEQRLLALSQNHSLASCRLQLLRTLVSSASSPAVCNYIYNVWEGGAHPLASESDYMNMAYELALHYPQKYQYIVEKQATRIKNPDRARQFAFISQAVNPSVAEQERLFNHLLTPEGRRTEPWAIKALSLLCHPSREKQAVKYIRPALDALQGIQRTNDIFFPTRWVRALLRPCRSAAAAAALNGFLSDNPAYPPLLKSKILQAAWLLYRAQGITPTY